MLPLNSTPQHSHLLLNGATIHSFKMAIALTIHKSQGMTIGTVQQFEKVVVWLPVTGQKTQPGLELVAISRAVNVGTFAIGNEKSTLNRRDLQNIGATAAYQ